MRIILFLEFSRSAEPFVLVVGSVRGRGPLTLVLDALGCSGPPGALTLPFMTLFFFSVQHFLDQFFKWK